MERKRFGTLDKTRCKKACEKEKLPTNMAQLDQRRWQKIQP